MPGAWQSLQREELPELMVTVNERERAGHLIARQQLEDPAIPNRKLIKSSSQRPRHSLSV